MATMGRRLGVLAALTALLVLVSFSLAPASPPIEAQGDKGKDGKNNLIFEVYKDKGGDYRFRVKDEAGTILAGSGKGYDDKADCLKIIEVIKKGAGTAKIDDQSAKK
jgi:uncharacterized protein YegP (UPF0339 family)